MGLGSPYSLYSNGMHDQIQGILIGCIEAAAATDLVRSLYGHQKTNASAAYLRITNFIIVNLIGGYGVWGPPSVPETHSTITEPGIVRWCFVVKYNI